MYCGTDRNGWESFWAKREHGLTPHQLTPFYNNFACMMGIIQDCGLATGVENIRGICFGDRVINKSTLEIGAGRGTISELFHQKGFKTFATDLEDRTSYPRFPNGASFVKNDILESMPFAKEQFDIVFSYGLLEHFDCVDRSIIMERCLDMTKPGGVVMHYVVPRKWTNIREDNSVYRDKCADLKNFKQCGIKYVYPIWGDGWECSKFMSKGFILWIKKYTTLDQYVVDSVLPTMENKIKQAMEKL